MNRLVLLGALVATRLASADANVDEVRELIGQGKLAEARDLLQQVYARAPDPQLLFALGQLEMKLGDYPTAIRYYEQFIASAPPADQVALAQQAIGAARARLAQPEPTTIVVTRERPTPTYRRDWDGWSWALLATGGVVIGAGAGLVAYGVREGNRAADTLSQFAQQRERAENYMLAGDLVIAGGIAIAVSAAVRYAIHRVEVMPVASADRVGVVVGARW